MVSSDVVWEVPEECGPDDRWTNDTVDVVGALYGMAHMHPELKEETSG